MSIDPKGPRCYCGRRGCVERYISGSALQINYQEATGHKASAKTIVDLARIGAPPADVVLSDFLGRYAFAMANIIAVIDPDIVVVGGGLADVDEIYSIGTSRITSLVFNDDFSTPIVKNSLGSSSGVLGAAMIGA
jgi:fructokinase